MKVAKRGCIPPFRVMEALREAEEYAAKGADIIHLSLGQPGQEAPERVRRKVADMLIKGDNLGYTDASGLMPLRERIAQHYKETYGYDVPANRIAITVGASGAFFTAMMAAFDPGDKVALVNPCYPAYPAIMEAVGVEPVKQTPAIRGSLVN